LYLICVEQLIGSPGGIYFNLSLKTYHSIKVMLITLEVTSTLVNSTALFYLLLEVYFAFFLIYNNCRRCFARTNHVCKI